MLGTCQMDTDVSLNLLFVRQCCNLRLFLISIVRFCEIKHSSYNLMTTSAAKLAKLCCCAVCVRFRKTSRVLLDGYVVKVSQPL